MWLHAYLVLGCISLISCDDRRESENRVEEGDVNVRTKRAQRPITTDPTSSAETQNTPLEPSAQPAQSTDESIAEWAWGMMETRPDLVVKAIRELPPDSIERQSLIRAYVMELLQRNPDEAIAWANSLGDQKSILAAREEIAMALPIEQINRSVQLLLDPVRISRQGFDNSSARLLERWIGHNPETAARWVMGLPPGQSRDAGIRTLTSEWLQSDSQAVLQWLTAQPATSIRHEIVTAMAQSLVETEETQRTQILESATPAIRQDLARQIDALLPPPPPAIIE